jgi:hypothetical protein
MGAVAGMFTLAAQHLLLVARKLNSCGLLGFSKAESKALSKIQQKMQLYSLATYNLVAVARCLYAFLYLLFCLFLKLKLKLMHY